MKKLVISIVALCYFAVSCGVVVNFHYCMDRLASTSFFAAEIKKCGRCGMEIHQSNGCCRDEMQLLKLEDDQDKTTIADFSIPAMEPAPATPSEFIATAFYNFSGQRHFLNHSPPILSEQDTYLQHNVFRI